MRTRAVYAPGDVFELRYTGERAMSDDQLFVAQRVTQEPTDNASLSPMVQQVELQYASRPEEVLADSGCIALKNLECWRSKRYILPRRL